MRKPKITVVGAGDVGVATARRLAQRHLGDVVVLDLRDDGDDATAGSDVLIVAAGSARTPGKSRDELQEASARAVSDAVSRAVRKSRDSIIVMVSEPVDVMCEAARRASGFPRERVIGATEALDPALVRAFAVAEPGAAGEIARRRAAGSPPDLPGAAVEIAEAVVNDRKRVLPCLVYLQGEFGVRGAFVAVPARIGAGGVEGVVEVPLDAEEMAQLRRAAGAAGGGRT